MYKCYMILTLFIQVLQVLNAKKFIVAPLLAPLALILIYRMVGARAHSFPFVFFLGEKFFLFWWCLVMLMLSTPPLLRFILSSS
jgi:hypothetical protein